MTLNILHLADAIYLIIFILSLGAVFEASYSSKIISHVQYKYTKIIILKLAFIGLRKKWYIEYLTKAEFGYESRSEWSS